MKILTAIALVVLSPSIFAQDVAVVSSSNTATNQQSQQQAQQQGQAVQFGGNGQNSGVNPSVNLNLDGSNSGFGNNNSHSVVQATDISRAVGNSYAPALTTTLTETSSNS